MVLNQSVLKIRLKAEVGSLFLVSSGKNSIKPFQHIEIQVVCKNTTLPHLSLALFSDVTDTYQPVKGHSGARSYWLLYKSRCMFTLLQ